MSADLQTYVLERPLRVDSGGYKTFPPIWTHQSLSGSQDLQGPKRANGTSAEAIDKRNKHLSI